VRGLSGSEHHSRPSCRILGAHEGRLALSTRQPVLRFLVRKQHHAIGVEQHDGVLDRADNVEKVGLVAVESGPVRPDLPRQLVEFLGQRAQLAGPRDLHLGRTFAGRQLFEPAAEDGELFENPVRDQQYRQHRGRDHQPRRRHDYDQQMAGLVRDKGRRHAD